MSSPAPTNLPPFLELEVLLPRLDAPSLSSFIRCSKQQHQAWVSNPDIQAQWLWTHCVATCSAGSAAQAQQQAQPAFLFALSRSGCPADARVKQQVEAALSSRGPLFRALRSRSELLLREVLRRYPLTATASFAAQHPLQSAAAPGLEGELHAALHLAVVASSVPCLRHLLLNLAAARPNARICGLTAAHCAALFDRPEHLRLLLRCPGVDGSMLSFNQGLPGSVLHIAVSEGHLQCIAACLEAPTVAKVDVNQTHVQSQGRTALHWAASFNQADAVRLLLSAPGINVNAEASNRNVGGQDLRTPLQLAASYGCPASLAALLEAQGVDVNHVDGDGWTALYLAANSSSPLVDGRQTHTGFQDYAECVRLLLADPRVSIHFKIGDVPFPNRAAIHVHLVGWSALDAAQGRNEAAATLLAKAGVQPATSKHNGWLVAIMLVPWFMMLLLLGLHGWLDNNPISFWGPACLSTLLVAILGMLLLL